VTIGRDAVVAAVAAWDRDADHEIPETLEQRVARQRAGPRALIGLAIREGGRSR
jgi:hypothetical protein